MSLPLSLVAPVLMILVGSLAVAQEPAAQRPGIPTGAAGAPPAQDEGSLQGRVVDDRSGRPIARALVSLSGATQAIATAVADHRSGTSVRPGFASRTRESSAESIRTR